MPETIQEAYRQEKKSLFPFHAAPEEKKVEEIERMKNAFPEEQLVEFLEGKATEQEKRKRLGNYEPVYVKKLLDFACEKKNTLTIVQNEIKKLIGHLEKEQKH